jgi:hypothetical protein
VRSWRVQNRTGDRLDYRHAEITLAVLEKPLQPLGNVHPLPRRWPRLPHEQRRRTSVARCGGRKKELDLRDSDAGAHRAAVYTLIETCKMNDVDLQAWLADVLARLPDHPANKVADLLPWSLEGEPTVLQGRRRCLSACPKTY